MEKTCVAPAADGSCTTQDECPIGQFCVSRLCVATEPNNDPNNNPANNSSNNSENNSPVNNNPVNNNPVNNNPVNNSTANNNPVNNNPVNNNPANNNAPDREPPRVTAFAPAMGASGVPLDTTITVSFSEAVREFNLEGKFSLKVAGSGQEVPFAFAFDGTTATLTPSAPLQPATAYFVEVNNAVTDLAGNKLPDNVFWFFATVSPLDVDHYELARRFAPVVHQEVDDEAAIALADYFTRVDFDNNWIAVDNISTYRAGTLNGAAYYNVIETTTHYFIQYLFYYPAAYLSTSRAYVPHDVTGTQVVVKKGDPLQLVMVESGYRPQTATYWGFAPASAGIADSNAGALGHTFEDAALWEGTHFRAYHGSNQHGACEWTWGGPAAGSDWCRHPAGAFKSPSTSVTYYPFDQGSSYRDLACAADGDCFQALGHTCVEQVCKDADGSRALTYELVDLRSTLWLRRVNIGNGDNVFAGTTTYSPHVDSGDRPGAAQGLVFPAALATEGEGSRGILPFAWMAPGSVGVGQWWIDPAYAFSVRYTVDADPETYSLDYCYNLYLGIDQRGQGACP